LIKEGRVRLKRDKMKNIFVTMIATRLEKMKDRKVPVKFSISD
jgi:hypothetical protein